MRSMSRERGRGELRCYFGEPSCCQANTRGGYDAVTRAHNGEEEHVTRLPYN